MISLFPRRRSSNLPNRRARSVPSSTIIEKVATPFYSVLLPTYSVLPGKRLFFEGDRGACGAATPFLLRSALQRQLVDLRGVFQGQLLEGAKGTPLFWARVGSIFGMSASSTSNSARVVGMPRLAKKARVSSMAESARCPTPGARFSQSSFVFQPSRQATQTSFR